MEEDTTYVALDDSKRKIVAGILRPGDVQPELREIANDARQIPGAPPPRPGRDGNYFLQYNANKRSVAVNLKDPRGVELVKTMAKQADVMIENFAPGVVERLGLGPDVIRALNPSIIYCQVKAFGTGSPYEHSLAFDMIAQACGGLMSITGEEDAPPCKPGATIGDTGTGMVMAISVLGAYVRRLRTGQGEHLQLAMQDSVLHYIRNAFTFMERTGGKAAPRAGSKTVGGGNPPIGVYPCQGGGPNDYVYIYTSRANPEHWNRLLKVMGREDLIGDARYADPDARTERREEVDAIVTEWTRKHDKHAAMRMSASRPSRRAQCSTRRSWPPTQHSWIVASARP